MATIKISPQSQNVVILMQRNPELALTKRQLDNRCKKYLEVKKQIKALESQIAELETVKKSLTSEIVGCTINGELDTGKYYAKWSQWSQLRVDTARLEKDIPDIKERYPLHVPQSRLTVKEVKS